MIRLPPNLFSKSRSLLLITTVGVLVNMFIIHEWGIHTVADTARYFDYRDRIIEHGFFIDEHNFWYIGYVLFLVVCKMIGLPLLGVVILQCTLSIFASLFMFSSTAHITRSTHVGIIAAMAFLLWIQISQWNIYLLCESLYISFTAISFYFLAQENRNRIIEFLTIVSILITFSIKPTGLSMLLAGGVFFLTKTKLPHATKNSILLGLIIGAMVLANQMLSTFILTDTYATGDIIFGCSQTMGNLCPDYLTINTEGVTLVRTDQPVMELILFVVNNTWFFTQLTLAKLTAFLMHMKPYYSAWHNAFIAVVLLPTYYFFGRGLKKLNRELRVFVISYMAINCGIIMFTTEDWDGRFLMPLLPLLFVTASAALPNPFFGSRNVQ